MNIVKKLSLRRLFLITVGAVLFGLSLTMFLEHNKIAPGGVSGLAVVINNLWGFPSGLVMALMNVPLFILGLIVFGREETFYTLYSIVASSLATDYIPAPVLTDNLLLAAIFGGVVMGIGIGIMLLGGGNSGGTVMAARLAQHWFFRHMGITWILFAIDCVVVLFSAFAFGAEIAMYALIALYISSKVLDLVIEGATAKSVYVISPQAHEVGLRVLDEMERGATMISARGMYTDTERGMLMCVLETSREVNTLKEMVKEVDEDAFVIVNDVREVMGEGFKPKAGH